MSLRSTDRRRPASGFLGFLRNRSGAVPADMLAATTLIALIGVGFSFAFYGTGDGAIRAALSPLTHELAQNAENVRHLIDAPKPDFLK